MPNGQFNLTPDIIGSLSRGGQAGQQFQQIRQQPQIQLLRQQALQGDSQALQQLATIQPEAAQQVQVFQQNTFKNLDARDKQKITSVARAALQVQAIPTPEGKIEFLESRREELAKANIPTGETDEALNLYKAGRIDEGNQLVNNMVGIGQATGILQPGAKPQIKEIGGKFFSVTPGGVTEIPGQEGIKAVTEPSEVQSSKILPGGLVQIVRKDGTTEIKTLGEANADLVKAAEERGAILQGKRAGQRGAAAEAIKQSIVAFKNLKSVRKNIENMNEGIRLLEGGAKTGAVEGMLPSIREASVKLDNLRNRLGLDVIGGTTFGALSESELAFALKTALPTTLDEADLKQWMIEKRDAQAKVAINLEEAALFLGTPGNTIADFIKIKKAERQPTPQAGVSPTPQAPAQQPATPQVINFEDLP